MSKKRLLQTSLHQEGGQMGRKKPSFSTKSQRLFCPPKLKEPVWQKKRSDFCEAGAGGRKGSKERKESEKSEIEGKTGLRCAARKAQRAQ